MATADVHIPDWTLMGEIPKIKLFNHVLDHYREPGRLKRVLPRLVIPDTTNRSNTGLSVEHVHWIASKIQSEGFVPRSGSGKFSRGHDLPILIRESSTTEFGPESLKKWQAQLNDPAFPPLRLDDDQFFGSLGNGHFFQVRFAPWPMLC